MVTCTVTKVHHLKSQWITSQSSGWFHIFRHVQWKLTLQILESIIIKVIKQFNSFMVGKKKHRFKKYHDIDKIIREINEELTHRPRFKIGNIFLLHFFFNVTVTREKVLWCWRRLSKMAGLNVTVSKTQPCGCGQRSDTDIWSLAESERTHAHARAHTRTHTHTHAHTRTHTHTHTHTHTFKALWLHTREVNRLMMLLVSFSPSSIHLPEQVFTLLVYAYLCCIQWSLVKSWENVTGGHCTAPPESPYSSSEWQTILNVYMESRDIITWHRRIGFKVVMVCFPLSSLSGCERCPPPGRASAPFLESVLTAARYVCVIKAFTPHSIHIQHT